MLGHNQTVLEELHNCNLCCLVQTIQACSRNWIALWQNFSDCPFDRCSGKSHLLCRFLFHKFLPQLLPAGLLGHATWWHLQWLSIQLCLVCGFICCLLWAIACVQQAMEPGDWLFWWGWAAMDLNFHRWSRCVGLTLELHIRSWQCTFRRASASTSPTWWCHKTRSSHRWTGQDDQIFQQYHHDKCLPKAKILRSDYLWVCLFYSCHAYGITLLKSVKSVKVNCMTCCDPFGNNTAGHIQRLCYTDGNYVIPTNIHNIHNTGYIPIWHATLQPCHTSWSSWLPNLPLFSIHSIHSKSQEKPSWFFCCTVGQICIWPSRCPGTIGYGWNPTPHT